MCKRFIHGERDWGGNVQPTRVPLLLETIRGIVLHVVQQIGSATCTWMDSWDRGETLSYLDEDFAVRGGFLVHLRKFLYVY